jgi:hypothetical protein
LSHIRADDLLGMTMEGACERVGVDVDQIEDVVAGPATTASDHRSAPLPQPVQVFGRIGTTEFI